MGIPEQFGEKLSVATSFNGELALDTATPRFVKPVEGTHGFTGGNSGYGATEDGSGDKTALIGTPATKTGLYALDDDSLNISIAAIPGVSDQDVQNALITLGESSKNFLALIAPPYAVGNTQDAVDWLNGKGTRTAAINSSYAAAYWPWVQVFNSFAGAEEWYDPSIFAARQCVFTDSISEPWFAPAGFRRGRLTKPSDTEQPLNQGDRDTLYSNAVNPISKEPQTGITIFGQKTTQRLPTALDRVNVRRLMIFIRKTLLQLGKPFQFEPNDAFTWELVESSLNPFISDLLARRAIVEGSVQCDSSTNTPLRVDRNELWCSITIKPTKAAETIVFEVNLTSQSATISG
jgi:phage tail sheath protein FI